MYYVVRNNYFRILSKRRQLLQLNKTKDNLFVSLLSNFIFIQLFHSKLNFLFYTHNNIKSLQFNNMTSDFTLEVLTGAVHLFGMSLSWTPFQHQPSTHKNSVSSSTDTQETSPLTEKTSPLTQKTFQETTNQSLSVTCSTSKTSKTSKTSNTSNVCKLSHTSKTSIIFNTLKVSNIKNMSSSSSTSLPSSTKIKTEIHTRSCTFDHDVAMALHSKLNQRNKRSVKSPIRYIAVPASGKTYIVK